MKLKLNKFFLISILLITLFSCQEKEYKVIYSIKVPPGRSLRLFVKYYDKTGGKIIYTEEDWQKEVTLTRGDVAQLFAFVEKELEPKGKDAIFKKIKYLTEWERQWHTGRVINGRITIGDLELQNLGEVVLLSHDFYN